jgi:hypothetical protein
MASVQLSGIASTLASGNAAAGAPVPTVGSNASGRATPTGALNRGPHVGDAAGVPTGSASDTPVALAPKIPDSAPPADGGAASNAIATQMVLVFDDQTHSMTVKILDILTQKVEPPPPLPLETTVVQGTFSRQGGSGTLVDTKA